MGISSVAGVVLAGGGSKRLGFDKAFAEVGGKAVVERVLGVLRGLFREVFVVALELEPYARLGVPVHRDLLPGNDSMGGIHAALSIASVRGCFVCACDMPFLSSRLLERMAELSREGADVVVPRGPRGLEPLCAVYSKGCLPAIERSIRAGRLKLTGFFGEVAVRVVEGEELERLDPGGLSFLNVNTAEELEAARALAREHAFKPSRRG